MHVITFWVPGHAKTKGSMNKVGARMVQTVKGSSEWAALVTDQARRALQTAPASAGAVWVSIAVWLPVTDITARGSGDVDKLARNVLDALDRAGVYGDDAQVTDLMIRKHRADSANPAGVLIIAGERPGLWLSDAQDRDWAMRAQGLLS